MGASRGSGRLRLLAQVELVKDQGPPCTLSGRPPAFNPAIRGRRTPVRPAASRRPHRDPVNGICKPLLGVGVITFLVREESMSCRPGGRPGAIALGRRADPWGASGQAVECAHPRRAISARFCIIVHPVSVTARRRQWQMTSWPMRPHVKSCHTCMVNEKDLLTAVRCGIFPQLPEKISCALRDVLQPPK